METSQKLGRANNDLRSRLFHAPAGSWRATLDACHLEETDAARRNAPAEASFPSTVEILSSADDLAGKVVVVTGAAQGLGLAAAKLAAGKGTKVVLSDVNEEKLKVAEEEVKQEGGTTAALFIAVTRTDLKALLSQLRSSPSTIFAATRPKGTSLFGLPTQPLYAASKHAVLGLARSLHCESESCGIAVNAVLLWITPTLTFGAYEEARKAVKQGKVEDVASAMIAGLTSGKSGLTYVTDPEGVIVLPLTAKAYLEAAQAK
ncbi:hypothetical protein JCM11641_004282 [Rhodosporidiobolus odoratus]